ncbi:MAG: MarR family transcriptional regulator [Gammaproteobacteria bacterium]|nr:MarR family transcriptional regulator [Gammaproteobacteria bacterium]
MPAESEKSNESPEWFDAWRGVLFAHGQVIRAVEKYLHDTFSLPLSWFDVLSRLNGAPNNRLRMSELSAAALFTRSGLTRLVDRIEEAGLVRRERIDGDRRGINVVLEPEGRKIFRRAFKGHKSVVEGSFASNLTPRQLREVGDALLNFWA